MGTVTHQYIGYLWPMGPFYWVFQQLGVPDWVAQRIWLGTLMLAAGLGVRYLCRTLGWGDASTPATPSTGPPGAGSSSPASPTCSARTCSSTRPGSRSSCCRGRRCPG